MSCRLPRSRIRLKDSERELFDGPFIVGQPAGLIRAAQIAARAANLDSSDLPELSRAMLRAAIGRFCDEQRAGKDYVRLPRVYEAKLSTERRLNIVIPIYRGVSITKDCVDSVLQHRRHERDAVILVNDCSPEPEMASVLAGYLGQPNLHVLTNQQNLGFVKSANRGMKFCEWGDVILLNSDARVFEGGFDELWRVAHSARDMGHHRDVEQCNHLLVSACAPAESRAR